MVTCGALEGSWYAVQELDDGQACLDAMGEAPDLILMDVEMPGMNGISTCKALREAGHDEPQVLFISAHDDLETRLAAYNAGGNDFITKPFLAEELAGKVRVAELAIAKRRDIAQQAHYAQQTAFSAMSSMGEMGVVLQFLRASFTCNTPDELAATLFESLAQYGLVGMLELRHGGTRACHSSQGECSPLEHSILGHARDMGRVFQFRDRLAINYPHITLLLPNLPMDSPDKVGRLRDHLAIIAEGAEARLEALENAERRLRQADAIVTTVTELGQVLAEIERQQQDNRMQTLEIGYEYMQQLNEAFIHLGLNDGQETELVNMAQATNERISGLLEADKSLGERLRKVTESLRTLQG